MDAADRQAVLDRAESLLPKYGGFASGAVNQAALLLGVTMTAEEHRQLAAELAVVASDS